MASLIKKGAMLAIAVIALTVFSQRGYSQFCYNEPWVYGAGTGWWNYNVPSQYSLSTDQIAKMNEIRSRYDTKILPLERELNSLTMEYNLKASQPEADIKKLRDYRNRIQKIENQIEDLRLSAQSEINKILTDDQRLFFNSGGYGWWDGNMNWWCMNDYGYRNPIYNNRYYRGNMMSPRGYYCW